MSDGLFDFACRRYHCLVNKSKHSITSGEHSYSSPVDFTDIPPHRSITSLTTAATCPIRDGGHAEDIVEKEDRIEKMESSASRTRDHKESILGPGRTMMIDLNRNRSLSRQQPLQYDTITPATTQTARTGGIARIGGYRVTG